MIFPVVDYFVLYNTINIWLYPLAVVLNEYQFLFKILIFAFVKKNGFLLAII